MPQPKKRSWRALRTRDARASDVKELLEVFSALDRIVIEISMHVYNVPPRDRSAMLEQHRRLHNAIRQGVPAFLPLERISEAKDSDSSR